MATEYVRAKAVARQLAVSVKKVYKMVRAGELVAVKVGRSVCILAGSLEDYLAARVVRMTEAPPAVTRPPSGPTEFLFLPRRA